MQIVGCAFVVWLLIRKRFQVYADLATSSTSGNASGNSPRELNISVPTNAPMQYGNGTGQTGYNF